VLLVISLSTVTISAPYRAFDEFVAYLPPAEGAMHQGRDVVVLGALDMVEFENDWVGFPTVYATPSSKIFVEACLVLSDIAPIVVHAPGVVFPRMPAIVRAAVFGLATYAI
jgi:hypothetical protein